MSLVEKHQEHIAAFQKFCLDNLADPETCDDLGDMHYESMALGYLLGRGVPYAEAFELAVIGNIEPEYPKN